MRTDKGFSLLELLIVIAIIGILMAVAVPNLLGIRQRAADAKIKASLREIKSGLSMYYAEMQSYPPYSGGSDPKIRGCGADYVSACPCSSSAEWAAGGSGCDTVFMKRFPRFHPNGTGYLWNYSTNGNDFCLSATLANKADPDLASQASRCASICGSICNSSGNGVYCVCAD